MPTELERLATLEAEVREIRALLEQNRAQIGFWVAQAIQLIMIAALWFKKG